MTAQILAAVIFVGMFALIIMDKFERQYVTLGSAALVLVVVFGICMHSCDAIKNALNLGAIFRADFWYGASESASSGVNWSTIFFITGMMIMVEGLGKSGFFRWLCLSLAKLAHYHVVPLLLCFMAMSAFLAMFIDSITVVLFLATVTLELAQILCFDPVPMILSEVFCANLGGAATMCGDPPNIIIGTALGYTFTDFIKNTGVIIGICFVFVLIFSGSVFLIAFDDFDLITNFTAVAATINNIGPGFELVGPNGNFSMFSCFSKLVLTFDMLAGRLEIFPLLLLFVRDTWKKF